MAVCIGDGVDPHDLMSSPDPNLIQAFDQGEDNAQTERVTCSYTNNSARFRTADSLKKEKAFKTQFASIYFQRLAQMSGKLRETARARWIKGKASPPKLMSKILELAFQERSIIIGTVYKEMTLKPNILDEYHAREKYEAPPPERSKYHQPDDSVVLEDQSGRIAITGKITPGELVSGVVMAILGHQDEDGDFVAEDVCFCDGAAQSMADEPADDVFVALVSGLDIGPSNHGGLLPLQMFIDYVTGQLGSSAEQQSAGKIARVVIAGNLIERVDDDGDDVAVYKKKGVDAKTVKSMAELDEMLAYLTACVPVDIMSGPHDPSNQTMPQQPMHRCMFPKSASTGLLRGVTNPYDCTINGQHCVGTSGQNVDDIYRFSEKEDRLEILEQVHNWRHLAPTAPDTLGCFPFYESDPFVVLDSTPNVLFAGNQPKFGTKAVVGESGQQTRLICVPSFSTTQTVVLLNTKTLECYPVSFAGFAAGSEQPAAMEQ